ncbi:MAG: serine hydrolase [Maribacter sp.]
MKRLSFLLVLMAVSNTALQAQQLAEIDSVFTVLNQQRGFNGNILIAEKGKIIYERSFGFSNYDDRTPLRPQHMFNVASVSKTITAVATMQLVERGLLNLNDDLTKHLSGLPYQGIRIQHLLSHTSGLPKVQIHPFRKEISGKRYTNEELLEVYTRVAPELYFSPGSNYNYANTNYIFLALIIEKISKLSFEQFLQQHIFEPSGMHRTFLFERNVPLHLQKNVVSYYRKPKWLSKRFHLVDTLAANIEDSATFDNIYGASSIHTTAGDLLKFHTALQNNVLLSIASLTKMYDPITLNGKKEFTINEKSNYPAVVGTGWQVAKDSTVGKIVYHSGGFQGGRSFMIRNLKKDQCVILLTNNVETDRYTFTTPMRILNRAPYQLDRISLPRLFSNEYISNGIAVAVSTYQKYKNDTAYVPFVDYDFEEIGTELMNAGDLDAAVKIFELYADTFPDEYSWSMLGDAHLLSGNESKALECFEKSLSINSEYGHSKNAVLKIKGGNGK